VIQGDLGIRAVSEFPLQESTTLRRKKIVSKAKEVQGDAQNRIYLFAKQAQSFERLLIRKLTNRQKGNLRIACKQGGPPLRRKKNEQKKLSR